MYVVHVPSDNDTPITSIGVHSRSTRGVIRHDDPSGVVNALIALAGIYLKQIQTRMFPRVMNPGFENTGLVLIMQSDRQGQAQYIGLRIL